MKLHRLFLFLLAAALPAEAAVTLSAIFRDHMVLQRDMPVPIWGKAAPGERVEVRFRGQTKSTTAGTDGHWQVKLAPLQTGDPATLEVEGQNKVTFSDVLVGEVWIGSGQSNMALAAKGFVEHGDTTLGEWVASASPQVRLFAAGNKAGWQVATPETAERFSALLYGFGHRLHGEMKVPVGLIVAAVSGQPSRCFLSQAMFDADPACRDALARAEAAHDPVAATQAFAAAMAEWEVKAAAAKAAGKPEPRKPAKPADPRAAHALIGNHYARWVAPIVPFAIRGALWDQGESGTALPGVDQPTLMGALIRGWRSAWGQGDFPFIYIQKPSGAGCRWDAAETPDPRRTGAKPLPPAPPKMDAGLNREAHIRIAAFPRTAMVGSSDLSGGIHPGIKSAYSERAARVASGFVYRTGTTYAGPTYRSHAVEGRSVRVEFDHVGTGLKALPGRPLQGFDIAGADGVFHWAEATIRGASVILSAPAVQQPFAVRYAWDNNIPWATLFNADGFPAVSFRADRTTPPTPSAPSK